MMVNNTAENLLIEINEALARIQVGSYGICVDTGENISNERLKALPYVKRTLEAQENLEKRMITSLPERKVICNTT